MKSKKDNTLRIQLRAAQDHGENLAGRLESAHRQIERMNALMDDKDLTIAFQATSLDALRTAFLRDVMVMRNMSKFFDVDLTKVLEL